MTQTEVLRLALEFFETMQRYKGVRSKIFIRFEPTATGDYLNLQEFDERAKPVITAIKAALEAKDEPVAWMCADESLINKGYARFSHVCMGEWKIPVYTTPPQRKPLTDEEINALDYSGTRIEFVRAIEAKLKEKNT
jgi:hypothetical protein